MNIKSQHFFTKFQKTQASNFFLFTNFTICKANSNSKLTRDIYVNDFKRFTLPSAFKLEKDHKVQGPIIGIIHSPTINLSKFHVLKNFRAISFKWKKRWYVFSLIEELLLYKKPLELCFHINGKLTRNLFQIPIIWNISKN